MIQPYGVEVRLLGFFIAPFSIAVFPSEAATFTSFSGLNVELNNFNQVPQAIAFAGEGTSKTIAEEGLFVSDDLDVDANFRVMPTPVVAYSTLQSTVYGTANRYLGDQRFSSTLIGQFSILAGGSLNFDFSGSLALVNSTDDLLVGNVSSLGNITLFLQDSLTQKKLDIFEVFGTLNSNPITHPQGDFLSQKSSSNFRLNDSRELISVGEINEIIQAAFTGSFQRQFEQDTQVDLVIVAQSCNYASNEEGECVRRVSEPSNKLAMIIFSILLGGSGFFSRIVKSINKLTR